MKARILFVDDDFQLSLITKEYLEAKDFEVQLIHNANDGLAIFKQNTFDLCLLDVKMPIRDGFSLASEIRTLDPAIPIIFLTGKTEVTDRIKGLRLGADDYVTKPFSMEELTLRMNAVLKRTLTPEDEDSKSLVIGDYDFNPISRELGRAGTIDKLSAIEAQLLQLLGENLNGLVKRDYALNKIWLDEDHLKGRSLNVYISKLRKYLKEDERIEILNVHGEGYRLVVKE
ncbi:MAG: response regulator transcription factor [Bacteroidota bacterium]